MERVWQPLAFSLAEGFLRCHPHLSPDPDKSIPMAFPMDKTRTTQDPKMCRTKAVSPPASCQRHLLARRETASLAFKDASPGLCWWGKLRAGTMSAALARAYEARASGCGLSGLGYGS